MTKKYQIAKPTIKKKQHIKLRYITNTNLAKISKIANEILFLKDSTNIKPDFDETYTLGKNYKVYNRDFSIDITNKIRIYLYVDLFG